MIRVRVDASAPDPVSLEAAAAIIRSGGLVIVPTDTLYGLAADPANAEAVRRIFSVKGRSHGEPLPLIAADTAQVVQFVGPLPPAARQLANRFWPGPLTLLLPAAASIADEVTGGTGRVGVRVPDHVVAKELCRACRHPLTATSANLSGHPPSEDPNLVAQAFGGRQSEIDMLIDAGKTSGGAPSTIVDVADLATEATQGGVRLVRAGAISWEDIQICLRG
jgi:L-threonylcarbamoyladenylate synthase